MTEWRDSIEREYGIRFFGDLDVARAWFISAQNRGIIRKIYYFGAIVIKVNSADLTDYYSLVLGRVFLAVFHCYFVINHCFNTTWISMGGFPQQKLQCIVFSRFIKPRKSDSVYRKWRYTFHQKGQSSKKVLFN